MRIFRSTKYMAHYTCICKNSYSVRHKSISVEDTIRKKLQSALETTHVGVDAANEPSGNNKPEGEKTHLRLVVVTDKFHRLPMYKRYNLVNDILKEELQNGTHIFSIVAKTPIQWHRSQAAKEHNPDSGAIKTEL